MRFAFTLIALIALVHCVGCGMAGPGIARIQAAPPPGQAEVKNVPGFYADKSWVNPYPGQIDPNKPHLSEDISDRKLGERSLSKDLAVDGEGRQLTGAAARQEKRRQARQAEWKLKMGLESSKPSANK